MSSTTAMASASLASLEAQVTSLSLVMRSASALAATGGDPQIFTRELAGLSASLVVAQDQLLIATATDSSVIASATAQLAVDQASLSKVLIDIGFYSGMVPNFGFNLAMCVIFGIFTIFYFYSLVYKQWWFSISFLCATILEVLGYAGRVKSNRDPQSKGAFLLQFICLTIAPVFSMAGIYYQLAKLAKIYDESYLRLKPLLYSYIFITADVLSLVIQAIGGGQAGIAVTNNTSPDKGTHVFVAGLALQVLSMTIFLFFWLDFLHHIYFKAPKMARNSNVDIDSLFNPLYTDLRRGKIFKYFNFALTAAVIFIYVRCIYRVCELAEGWSGFLMTHESYFIGLDAVMVSAATLVLIIFFPGFAFDGRHTSIPVKNAKKSKSNNSTPSDEEFASETKNSF